MDIAIICPLKDDKPFYSLTSVIKNQIQMLSLFRHKVSIIVRSDYKGANFAGASLLRLLPSGDLIDYRTKYSLSEEHRSLANDTALILSSRVDQFDLVITHDIVLTGFNLPYALAIMSVAQDNPSVPWLHWVHSFPFESKDWYDFKHYGENARIVYPNASALDEVSLKFNVAPAIFIPHIVDLRVNNRMSEQSRRLFSSIPGMNSADFVQLYPAATDRFEAKGIRELIDLFGLLKRRGYSVCLVVANQHSHRRKAMLADPIVYYERVAKRSGLIPYQDFFFTSEMMNGRFVDGVPQATLLDLFPATNTFFFPSRSESFGLGLVEALSCSALAVAYNDSLTLPVPLGTPVGKFPLGCVGDHFTPVSVLEEVADYLVAQVSNTPAIVARDYIRKSLNPAAVYNTYYKEAFSAIC